MKKNNKLNKIVILSVIAIIFTISLVIFILNYTKDDASLSLAEKNWISSHSNNVIDVSVYNDVPIYGQDGEGIIFSFLDDFTSTYNIQFNKISYLTENNSNLKSVAFRILSFNDEVTKNDIEIYKDYYVIVGKESNTINDISDLKDASLGVFDKDVSNIRYYLNDGKDIKIVSAKSFDEMLNFLNGNDIDYMAIPGNLYFDEILKNDLSIVYHISEVYNRYVLTIKDNKELLNIMRKFNMTYSTNNQEEKYKTFFLSTFFKNMKITEAEKMNYNASSYTYGYTINMPFESTVNKEFVGTISNYLSGFEDMANVDFKMVEYPSVMELKQALSRGEVDLIFANFDTTGVNVDVLSTNSPFKEEYVVLSKEPMLVNSIRSLKGNDIYTVSNTYIFDYLVSNGITPKSYNNTDELLRGIKNESIVMIDRDTYEYYKDNKFKNYKTIKYDYHTDYIVNSQSRVNEMLRYLFIVLGITFILLILLIVILKLKTKKKDISKEDKMKFIDVMTSLKNRNYLNYNIKAWEDNVIYPQTIVIIDLNNIKYINDNYGHEEGDEVIKKAASVLINNQQENTDIVRTDGNEFLIYMVGYDEKQVIEFTRKISKDLKELPHGFGATLGYSMITDDVKTIDDAINEATLSMRQAKEKL